MCLRAGPRTFFGAAVASFASPLDKLKNVTNIYRCTTCAGHEIVTARRANISVVKVNLYFIKSGSPADFVHIFSFKIAELEN